MCLLSPGELVSHVLREEPVGHGGAVHDLRPDQFIHQHGHHLKTGSRDTGHVHLLTHMDQSFHLI